MFSYPPSSNEWYVGLAKGDNTALQTGEEIFGQVYAICINGTDETPPQM